MQKNKYTCTCTYEYYQNYHHMVGIMLIEMMCFALCVCVCVCVLHTKDILPNYGILPRLVSWSPFQRYELDTSCVGRSGNLNLKTKIGK